MPVDTESGRVLNIVPTLLGSSPDMYSPLRILHCVSSMKVGGMEHMVLHLAHAQRKLGHDAGILAIQPGELQHEAGNLGVPVNVPRGGHRALRGASAAHYFLRFKPQVIHAHNVSSLPFALLGKRLSRAPVVLTCHGEFQESHRNPRDDEWNQVESVVAVSQATAAQVRIPQIAGKLSVIYNGVELPESNTRRDAVRRQMGIDHCFVGIMVARIDALKGHDTLIGALETLGPSCPNLHILVVGDGTERLAFESKARAKGLDNLTFTGFRTDVSDLLSAADFFVLPSYTEGLPLSVLEAMSRKLPIIATPVGGIPELIDDEREGLLVSVKDSGALAAAMRRLDGDRPLARSLGESAFEKVLRQFTFEKMVAEYARAYRDARITT